MNPPNLNRLLLWSTAVVIISCAILFTTLQGLPGAWSIVVGIGGVWCSFALVMIMMHVFLYRPWDEREKQLVLLRTQNDIYREIFEVTRKVADAATQAATVERGMQASVETLRDELKLDGCSLRIVDPRNRELINVAGCGYREPNLRPVPLTSEQGIAGKAIAERRPVFVEDASQEPEFVDSEGSYAKIRSLFCVPLIEHGEVVGVLSGSCRTPRRFSEQEREILAMISSRLSGLLKQFQAIRTAS